ncbi:hypothetical protein PRZ48_004133 [Zasmidium cellare]|uniref:Uncharacterized protein n=1 Tax=Zasmidium cellare TaxID=395010 RepID=A0ABR0EZD2_ZASCE|nr:hypothetical protein PRZ48_004133 [Zasmidium cellare]
MMFDRGIGGHDIDPAAETGGGPDDAVHTDPAPGQGQDDDHPGEPKNVKPDGNEENDAQPVPAQGSEEQHEGQPDQVEESNHHWGHHDHEPDQTAGAHDDEALETLPDDVPDPEGCECSHSFDGDEEADMEYEYADQKPFTLEEVVDEEAALGEAEARWDEHVE